MGCPKMCAGINCVLIRGVLMLDDSLLEFVNIQVTIGFCIVAD